MLIFRTCSLLWFQDDNGSCLSIHVSPTNERSWSVMIVRLFVDQEQVFPVLSDLVLCPRKSIVFLLTVQVQFAADAILDSIWCEVRIDIKSKDFWLCAIAFVRVQCSCNMMIVRLSSLWHCIITRQEATIISTVDSIDSVEGHHISRMCVQLAGIVDHFAQFGNHQFEMASKALHSIDSTVISMWHGCTHTHTHYYRSSRSTFLLILYQGITTLTRPGPCVCVCEAHTVRKCVFDRSSVFNIQYRIFIWHFWCLILIVFVCVHQLHDIESNEFSMRVRIINYRINRYDVVRSARLVVDRCIYHFLRLWFKFSF